MSSDSVFPLHQAHSQTSYAISINEGLSCQPAVTVDVDWPRVMANRVIVLETVDAMPHYLLYPEITWLIQREKHPMYRLLLQMMWATGARVSEALAITPSHFVENEYGFGVLLSTLKRRGRPKKIALQRSLKRYIPIVDGMLQDRVQSYLYVNKFRQNQRIFPMTSRTVHRHINRLVEGAGGSPFRISSHTFRHSFAIHLVLHGRPLKYISQLLGHSSIESTEIYTNVLTVDGAHLLNGVKFH